MQQATTTTTDAPGSKKRQKAARRRASVVVVDREQVGAAEAAGNGGAHEGAAPEEADGARVRVLPLVRGDHRGGVLLRPLHPLLHPAPRRSAPVVAPACMHARIVFVSVHEQRAAGLSCMQCFKSLAIAAAITCYRCRYSLLRQSAAIYVHVQFNRYIPLQPDLAPLLANLEVYR